MIDEFVSALQIHGHATLDAFYTSWVRSCQPDGASKVLEDRVQCGKSQAQTVDSRRDDTVGARRETLSSKLVERASDRLGLGSIELAVGDTAGTRDQVELAVAGVESELDWVLEVLREDLLANLLQVIGRVAGSPVCGDLLLAVERPCSVGTLYGAEERSDGGQVGVQVVVLGWHELVQEG